MLLFFLFFFQINVAIQCLSTDFSSQKGVKVRLRVVVLVVNVSTDIIIFLVAIPLITLVCLGFFSSYEDTVYRSLIVIEQKCFFFQELA